MFIISGGKGIGKTRALIEKAHVEKGLLVCEDPVTMRDRAYGYGITGLDLVSYEDLFTNYAAVVEGDEPIFIHDINKFMKYCFGNVKGYSVCNE